MSELNRIKTVLFTAHSLNDALTKLDDLGVSYRECDSLDMWVINDHNVQFWPSNSSRMALTVFADEQFHDYDDRLTFLAHQRDMAESEVPATSPETAGEHLSRCQPKKNPVSLGKPQLSTDRASFAVSNFIPEQSTVSVGKSPRTWTVKSYPKLSGGAA